MLTSQNHEKTRIVMILIILALIFSIVPSIKIRAVSQNEYIQERQMVKQNQNQD